MLDQSNLSVQRCRFIFWVECSVGGYLALAKTIDDMGTKMRFYILFYYLCILIIASRRSRYLFFK
jgi:hypothetical protein